MPAQGGFGSCEAGWWSYPVRTNPAAAGVFQHRQCAHQRALHLPRHGHRFVIAAGIRKTDQGARHTDAPASRHALVAFLDDRSAFRPYERPTSRLQLTADAHAADPFGGAGILTGGQARTLQEFMKTGERGLRYLFTGAAARGYRPTCKRSTSDAALDDSRKPWRVAWHGSPALISRRS